MYTVHENKLAKSRMCSFEHTITLTWVLIASRETLHLYAFSHVSTKHFSPPVKKQAFFFLNTITNVAYHIRNGKKSKVIRVVNPNTKLYSTLVNRLGNIRLFAV